MAETKKKKRRLSTKMKRTIRFTLAGLLVVSAIVVAVIPEKKTEAGTGTARVTLTASDDPIPVISDTDTIYTTGDGMFQFAYVNKGSGADKVAVIVGYDDERSLSNGTLTIPDYFDAYVKYTDAQGTSGGYVAVGKNGKELYYPIYEIQENPTGTYDENGDEIMEKVKVVKEYMPCLYSMYNDWIEAEDPNDTEGSVPKHTRQPDEFYYLDGSAYKATTTEPYQRIQSCAVMYISSQHVKKTADGNGWELDTTPETGIFSKAGNVTNLITGENLIGIGNYAFYNCANLKSISLGDGANVIGNYAFANCVNLEHADFPVNSNVKIIGDHAFYNCRSLKEFVVPVEIKKIGDSAFEGCQGMESIDLNAGGQEVLLEDLGDDVFKNCTSLMSLSFPASYNKDFDISWVIGDINLRYIKVPNALMKLVENSSVPFTFEDLMDQSLDQFYFEGPETSEIHNISKTNSFAFKYLDEEIYEKVYNVNDAEQGTGQIIYQVNDKNELIYFYMDDTVLQVQIPEAIGPYNITVIGSDSFQGNHNITRITIPASITGIEENAFKGCHRLKDVIFTDPSNLAFIGDGAFDTQVIDPVIDTCTLDVIPELTFTGICREGSLPFDYAMNPDNKINRGTQPVTYIKFFSGWPSNLTIQYNLDKDSKELINYPRLSDLASYTSDNSQRDKSNFYPYLTKDQISAATGAYTAYLNGDTITEDQQEIINTALNIVLPEGIETVKTGLFSGKDEDGNDNGEAINTQIKSITTLGLDNIDSHMFDGCTGLLGVYVSGDTKSVGDYAFKDCENLIDVDMTPFLEDMGLIPFTGCERLVDVDFGASDNFLCSDAVIYTLKDGHKNEIVEVLQARGSIYGTGTMSAAELAGVEGIREEAFKDCPSVLSVDLSSSKVKTIPRSCFENTPELYSVTLNDGCKLIDKNAFKNSNIRYVDIPNSVSTIDNSSFDDDPQIITFYCQLDSNAKIYADMYDNIIVAEKEVTYHVYFYDEDGVTLLDTIIVKAGENATSYVTPTKEGYTFKGWFPAKKLICVEEETKVYATYELIGEKTYTVTFVDYDDSIICTQTVKEGEDALAPEVPARKGYKFTGWRPGITNITEDRIVYAQYEADNSKSGSGKDDGNKDDNKDDKDKGNSGNNGNSGDSKTLYTLTVVEGSGSGSYTAGATVIVAANNAPSGKKFDKWTTDNANVKFAAASVAATTFTMPAENVTVTANYVEDKSSGSGSSSSGNSGTNSTVQNVKPNTTVDLTKDGFSNGTLAYANVAGSTDNYILKITDSAVAKSEVEEALKEEYSSLNNIKYVAMDISLYDSTGKNKIENTDSLKVNVTLPIPDSLIAYAGNNKVAYVNNGKLVSLKPKFTTINNVPCISFTATHFSPYTIYVDTAKLDAGTIQDYTPKTGDGISPKWFISLGLIGIAFILLLIKDKKKVKVKA